MFTPIDFSRIEAALRSTAGWVELAVVAVCIAVGWLLDRRERVNPESDKGIIRIGRGSVHRMLPVFVSLALLLVAAAFFGRWFPPIILSIAIPLAVALAAIRVFVYVLRELFGTPAWLPVSERVIAFAIWFIALLHFTGVLPELRSELDAMQIPIGSRQVSVLELLKGAVVVLLTIAGALWLSGLIEQRLQRAGNLDSSVRAVTSKLLRATLLVIGILFALQAVGIDLTLLTVFGGALGVGIGLGLQKLASNYIAGFTILLDRSIRLGDMITVDNRFGVVAKVTSRYVVIRGGDGVDAVVPNETLVTTTVLNHSYSGREIRVAVAISVSHDSNIELALKLMEEAARTQPRVLRGTNEPTAFLVRFTESGIDLELGVWINDPENGQLNLRSALNLSILRAFQAHGIRIPTLQRELRLAVPPGATGAIASGSAPSGIAG